MKISVYAICKNEAKHIIRWHESIKEADEIVVLDTGSTDNSVKLLKQLGVKVVKKKIKPWRFDDARNLSLDLVSLDMDVCLSLDMDEVMLPGWRQGIEAAFVNGVTEIRYPYVFNWNDVECTIPRITMYNFKIHARHGYSWKYPIHEIVSCDEEEKAVSVTVENIHCHHYPDATKERNYQVLLDQACIDEPDNERFSHLRGRELMMYNKYEEAIIELERHLTLKDSNNQCRALSHRYIARCMKSLNIPNNFILEHMLKSVAESPYQRESWVWLSQIWLDVGNYPQAYACAQTGLKITDKTTSFESEEGCWGDIPHKISEIAFNKMMEVIIQKGV